MAEAMVKELVTDLATWKELLTKNTWRKWYRKSSAGEERAEVIDMFCASFSTVNHNHFVGIDDLGVGSFKFMRAGNALAEGLASQREDHCDGWRLHRDWFKCMIAQLAITAANERDATDWDLNRGNYKRSMQSLYRLFTALKWDLKRAINPVGDQLSKVEKVWFNYIDKKSGINEKRFYYIILESTLSVGNEYRARSGKCWKIDGIDENGNVKLSNVPSIGEKKLNMKLSLSPTQVCGMELVY